MIGQLNEVARISLSRTFDFPDTFHILDTSEQPFKEAMSNTHAMLGVKICCNCTLSDCLHHCTHNVSESCDGVDYDVIHEACYYHDTWGLCLKPQFKLGVYQVKKTSCSEGELAWNLEFCPQKAS